LVSFQLALAPVLVLSIRIKFPLDVTATTRLAAKPNRSEQVSPVERLRCAAVGCVECMELARLIRQRGPERLASVV
jgi:hypothetical protein